MAMIKINNDVFTAELMIAFSSVANADFSPVLEIYLKNKEISEYIVYDLYNIITKLDVVDVEKVENLFDYLNQKYPEYKVKTEQQRIILRITYAFDLDISGAIKQYIADFGENKDILTIELNFIMAKGNVKISEISPVLAKIKNLGGVD